MLKNGSIVKERDKEIKKLQQVNPFWRDENWHSKYNEEAINALMLQGYSRDTAIEYLEKKNKTLQNFANKIWKDIEEEL